MKISEDLISQPPVLGVNSTIMGNNTGPSNSTVEEGSPSCDQCVDRSIVYILAGALAGTAIASIVVFFLYRKRAKRKEREAGNVSIDISRGPKR